jgi:fatty acid desaturase
MGRLQRIGGPMRTQEEPHDDGTVNDMEMRFPKEHVWYRRGVLIAGVLFWTAALWMAWGYIPDFIRWAWGR